MIGKLRNGRIINGRLAELFVSRGIAVEVKEKEANTDETNEDVNVVNVNKATKDVEIKTTQQPKRKRRTKAEIEASKKK